MNLINNIIIRLTSDKIGTDEFGNIYYEQKNIKSPWNKKRRYVVYSGSLEASKVPSEWHCWLHYTTDTTPVNINTHKHSWQKIHLPNLTGTKFAHFPFGSINKGGIRHKVSSDYQAWTPNK